ncbi:MAG TPA: hypothetical protein VJ987_14690 [Anaerolineales bacterium]|nr:hypothetical protein [Anaerolineales bacterium]
MLIRQISLKHGVTVGAANISDNSEIQDALTALEIPHPMTAIVLVGGAGGIESTDEFPMKKAINIIARLAEETQSVIVDGGTQAGIMMEIGEQRKKNNYTFPLIGVVFDNLVIEEDPKSILDQNHTHFFLIPGSDWGDESGWIAKIATAVAGDENSITILVNGGNISRTDVEYGLLENRPAYIMRGTGRLADEITITRNVVPIDISKNSEEILKILKEKLV